MFKRLFAVCCRPCHAHAGSAADDVAQDFAGERGIVDYEHFDVLAGGIDAAPRIALHPAFGLCAFGVNQYYAGVAAEIYNEMGMRTVNTLGAEAHEAARFRAANAATRSAAPSARRPR